MRRNFFIISCSKICCFSSERGYVRSLAGKSPAKAFFLRNRLAVSRIFSKFRSIFSSKGLLKNHLHRGNMRRGFAFHPLLEEQVQFCPEKILQPLHDIEVECSHGGDNHTDPTHHGVLQQYCHPESQTLWSPYRACHSAKRLPTNMRCCRNTRPAGPGYGTRSAFRFPRICRQDADDSARKSRAMVCNRATPYQEP